MGIQTKEALIAEIDQFKKTQTFKYFYSTLLHFDESLNCFVATEKWRDKEAELLTAAWWMFAELAKVQAVQEWISVEDQMPMQGQKVLLFRPHAHEKPYGDPIVKIATYVGEEIFINSHFKHVITHWMPLPKDPKVQEQK